MSPGLVLRELWGLFVDDGSLAAALVLWCASAGLALPRLALPPGWSGPVLALGCIAILIANLLRTARRKRADGAG